MPHDRHSSADAEPAPGPHFHVTAALIQKEGRRFLIARRSPHGVHGGLWEFPGGKQEPGETLEQCLAREILEELDTPIIVGDRLAAVRQAYDGFGITLHLFSCRLAPGAPPPVGDHVRWVSLGELDGFAFPQADVELIRILKKGDRTLFREKGTGLP